MPRVLLAAKDWKFRALLRAQLQEEGFEVTAQESTRDALNELTNLADLPKLLVADVTGSIHPVAEVDLLARWAPFLPVWLILSQTVALNLDIKGLGFEWVIYRPQDMACLVDQIKNRVAGA
ncbi:MAG: hypothetical protein ACRD1O_09140 [Terriglobia bacterium]